MVTKTILWIVLGAAATTILLRVRRQGLQAFRRDLAATPQLVLDVRARAGIAGDAWLLGAAAASLLFLQPLPGAALTALTLAVWIFATLSLKDASLLFLAVWLAWQDMGKGRAGPVGQAPEANVVFAAMVGLALGSGVAFLLPWQPWAGIIVAGGALACLPDILPGQSKVRANAVARRRGGWRTMKRRTDFVTNSSSMSWIMALLFGIPIGLGAGVGCTCANVAHGLGLGAGGKPGQLGSLTTPTAPPTASSSAVAAPDPGKPRGELAWGGDAYILSGQDAVDWLTERGMMQGGRFTDTFWDDWYSRLAIGRTAVPTRSARGRRRLAVGPGLYARFD